MCRDCFRQAVATVYGKEQHRWYFDPHAYDYESFFESQDKFIEYADQYEILNAINPGKYGAEWVRRVVQGGRTCQVVTWEEAVEVLRIAKGANEGENLICINMTCICKRTRGGDVSEPICMFLIHPPKEEHARETFSDRINKTGEQESRYIYDPIDSDKMRELLLDYERRLGLVHTVFTIGFPSVITLCNCEMPYCHSMRQRFMYGVRESFLEGHYVASISNDECVGCGKCQEQCAFGAIRLDRKLGKVTTMPTRCMGCGICRSVCPTAAIQMRERGRVALLPTAEPVALLQESGT